MATLNIFATNMQRMAAQVPQNIVRMQREIALDVVEHVSQGTPVDSGQASGNWKTRIGSPETGYDPGPSAGPPKSYAEAQAALANLQHGQDVYITNNVPYIGLLNAGYSQQAPSLFVETAIVSAIAAIGRYNIVTGP